MAANPDVDYKQQADESIDSSNDKLSQIVSTAKKGKDAVTALHKAKAGSKAISLIKKIVLLIKSNPVIAGTIAYFLIGFLLIAVIISILPFGLLYMADGLQSDATALISKVKNNVCSIPVVKDLMTDYCDNEAYAYERMEHSVYKAIKNDYKGVVKKGVENVEKTLKDDYGCDLNLSSKEEGTYYNGEDQNSLSYNSTCKVTIRFNPSTSADESDDPNAKPPDIDTFVTHIAAYVNTVDSTIIDLASYDDVEQDPKSYGSYDSANDENEMIDNIYNDTGDESYGSNNDAAKYTEKLNERLTIDGDVFYTLDSKYYMETMVTNSSDDGSIGSLVDEELIWRDYYDPLIGDFVSGGNPEYYSLPNIQIHESEDGQYKEYRATIQVKYYDITVPILYDVSSYRSEELSQKVTNYVSNFDDSDVTEESVYSQISDRMQEKFDAFIQTLSESNEQYTNKYFNPDVLALYTNYETYLNNIGIGLEMYGVDRSIYGSEALEGTVFAELVSSVGNTISGYGISGQFATLSKSESESVWNWVTSITHVTAAKYKKQCVNFARAMVMSTYGGDKIDSAPGNGKEVVDNLVNNHGDFWQKQTVPAANSVFSVKRGVYGHVGWINDVYQDSNGEWRIVFSDGNVGGGLVRINCDVSLSDFNKNFGYSIVYAVPKS